MLLKPRLPRGTKAEKRRGTSIAITTVIISFDVFEFVLLSSCENTT